MAAKAQHGYAVYLFQQKRYADAVLHLDEVLREEETGERWSDWATAQFALRNFAEAERGFRRALELSPDLTDAAVNFGAMLGSQARWSGAVAMLEGALPKLEGEGRAAVSALVEQCRAQMGTAARALSSKS
jgi:Tfp pilus assembly protein PilF